MRGYYYLATPYTKYPGGIEAAFRLACAQSALLVRAGVSAFSPIAHTHSIAIHGNIDPLDLELWLKVDAALIASACGCIMLRAESWEQSKGMAYERDAFFANGRPVVYMDPGIVPAELRVTAMTKQEIYKARRTASILAVKALVAARQQNRERVRRESTPEGEAAAQAAESVKREWESYK